MTQYVIHAPQRVLIDLADTGTDLQLLPTITINSSNPTQREAWKYPGPVLYDAPSAEALDSEGNSIPYQVSGEVDSTLVGSYELTYTATDSVGRSATPKVLTVNVVDTQPPAILEITGTSTYDKNDTYVPPTATSVDSYDGLVVGVANAGDVAAIDMTTPGQYSVRYTFTDAAGNVGNDTWEITVLETAAPDTTPPVITLQGANPQLVVNGTTWTEPGYTCTDDTDGDITGNVVVGGDTVNTNIDNDYVITYDCDDAAGNSATQKTRTVTVFTPDPGGEGTYTQDIVVKDISGNGSTTPYVTRRLWFQTGDVLATDVIEIRRKTDNTVVTTQMEGEAYSHIDGSLAQATVIFEADTLVDDEEDTYEVWAVTGTKVTAFNGENEATSKTYVTTNSDWKMELTSGGTTYTADVNTVLASGTLLRSGYYCRRWKCIDTFGLGDLHAVFYVTVWLNGQISCWMQVQNGYTTPTTNRVYHMVVKNGGTTLKTYNNVDNKHHTVAFGIDNDGLQWWDGDEPTVYVRTDENYTTETYSVQPYMTGLRGSATGFPPARNYTPMTTAGLFLDLGAGGGRDDLGMLPQWSVSALQQQDYRYDREDRIKAMGVCTLPICLPEVLTNEVAVAHGAAFSYSGDGLGSVNRRDFEINTGNGGGVVSNWDDIEDWAHMPEALYYQAATTGDEWWIDLHAMHAAYSILTVNWNPARSGPYTINGRLFDLVIAFDRQERTQGWVGRTLSNCLFMLPDTHPAKNYYNDQVTEYFDFIDHCFAYDEADGSPIADESSGLGIYRTLPHYADAGAAVRNGDEFGPWQSSFLDSTIGLAALRGHAPTTLVQNRCETLAGRCVESAGGSPYHGAHVQYIEFNNGSDPNTVWYSTWAQCGIRGNSGSFVPSSEPGEGRLRNDGGTQSTSFAQWNQYWSTDSNVATVHGSQNVVQWAGDVLGFETPNIDTSIAYLDLAFAAPTDTNDNLTPSASPTTAERANDGKYLIRNPLA